jgi:GrpB-like predicted nucleotidyltransferase (UPF0157 family)
MGNGRVDAQQAQRLEIIAYDEAWPRAFLGERDRIAAAFGARAVRIDHNGSTSVPGLAAKPIIDIQISVAQLHPVTAYEPLLARLEYVHVPHTDDDVCPFFHRPAVWPHTHHVHVVQSGGDEERRTLAFRDYLRDHPAVARAYVELKRRLAARSCAADPASREAYANGKTDFVNRVVAQALAAGYPREL